MYVIYIYKTYTHVQVLYTQLFFPFLFLPFYQQISMYHIPDNLGYSVNTDFLPAPPPISFFYAKYRVKHLRCKV